MPRRQIAIKHLLLATFWAGVSLAAWGWAYRLVLPADPDVRGNSQLAWVLVTFAWSTIFVAIDTLVGHEKRALVIGAGMWSFMLLLCYLFLMR